MSLIERINDILKTDYDKSKGSLYVRLYKEAFPLNESLKENCKSCYNLAYQRLKYEQLNNFKNMAKSKNNKKEETTTEIEVVYSLRKLVDPVTGREFSEDENVGIKGVGILCNATLTESQVQEIINAKQERFLSE